MSAFMIYYNEVREDIRLENPEANFGGLSKIAGQRWREKTDEEKQPFQDKQAQAKVDVSTPPTYLPDLGTRLPPRPMHCRSRGLAARARARWLKRGRVS